MTNEAGTIIQNENGVFEAEYKGKQRTFKRYRDAWNWILRQAQAGA